MTQFNATSYAATRRIFADYLHASGLDVVTSADVAGSAALLVHPGVGNTPFDRKLAGLLIDMLTITVDAYDAAERTQLEDEASVE